MSSLQRGSTAMTPEKPLLKPQTPLITTTIRPFSLLPFARNTSSARNEATEQLGIDEEDVLDIYPCTALQTELIALSSKTPGTYVAQFCYILAPRVEIPRFRKAWNDVCAQCDILRTRIISSEHGILQVLLQDDCSWTKSVAHSRTNGV